MVVLSLNLFQTLYVQVLVLMLCRKTLFCFSQRSYRGICFYTSHFSYTEFMIELVKIQAPKEVLNQKAFN